VRVTQFALIAEINNISDCLGRKVCSLSIHLIDSVKEDVERGAKIVASPATVADVKNPREFLIHLALIPEGRRIHVKIKTHTHPSCREV
jgi:hypothetical protein